MDVNNGFEKPLRCQPLVGTLDFRQYAIMTGFIGETAKLVKQISEEVKKIESKFSLFVPHMSLSPL